jgi:hypothetical protein
MIRTVMTRLIATLATVSLSLTVVAAPPRAGHPLLGAWTVTTPRTSCIESATYDIDGRHRSTSAQEVVVSEYTVSDQPSEKGFYKLVDVIVQTNALPDCSGHVTPVGDVATLYLRFSDENEGFMMCADESSDRCFAAAHRSPTT